MARARTVGESFHHKNRGGEGLHSLTLYTNKKHLPAKHAVKIVSNIIELTTTPDQRNACCSLVINHQHLSMAAEEL